MLMKHEIETEMSIWRNKEFWNPEPVVCMKNDAMTPWIDSEFRWCRVRNGKLVDITGAELTEYRGKQPFTFGLYLAFGQVYIPMDRPRCRLGHARVVLEPRNFSCQPPPEFGRKIREVRPDSHVLFPDRQFECYLLDENDWKSFDNQMKQTLGMLANGTSGPAPDAYLHVTVSLDKRVHYTRDIPFTPVNELSEVEAVMKEQLRSLILTECPRLDDYFEFGCGYPRRSPFRPSVREAERFFA